ncbi:MAG: adenine phosphoribosyltransferase [Candidatus Krumholzibacteria bacterium]|nr:adenine phosphoribosyltransferase [Candidatus Krumholzibacteria bacterium]
MVIDNIQRLKALIRDIPDFPKAGILFRDITPLLLDADAFKEVIGLLYERYKDRGITKIVAIESRGFVFAAPLCHQLGAGLVPLRKPGKLPHETVMETYLLEYGESTLEMHKDAIGDGDTILVFDDLLATGGTAAASVTLVERLGGKIVEAGFVIELLSLKGREKLDGIPVFSLIQYD